MWPWKWPGNFALKEKIVCAARVAQLFSAEFELRKNFLDARVFARFGKNLIYWADYFRHWTPAQRREFFRWKREIIKQRVWGILRRDARAPLKVDAGNLVDLSSFPPDQRTLWRTHIGALLDFSSQALSRPRAFVPQPGASDALLICGGLTVGCAG